MLTIRDIPEGSFVKFLVILLAEGVLFAEGTLWLRLQAMSETIFAFTAAFNGGSFGKLL